MAKFMCVIWCPDCVEEEDRGCFDGGAESFGPFESMEEAERFGRCYTKGSPWKFKVGEDLTDE